MTYALLHNQGAALKATNKKPRFGWWIRMGNGKTLMALHEFNELHNDDKVDVMVIICPNSVIPVWQAEVKKWDFPFNVKVKPDNMMQVLAPCVVIYNYESLIASAGNFIPTILSNTRAYVVFDESIQIKSHKAARWKAVRRWEHMACFMRLLSGRPQVQSPMDLWTQLTLLGADVSKSPFAFRNVFCRMGGWMGKVIVGGQNEERLREIMNQVSVTIDSAGDLPPLTETERYCDMTTEQKRLYKDMVNDMVAALKSGEEISVQQAVHKTGKLRQIGSGMLIGEDGEARQFMDIGDVPKTKLVDELLEEVDGKVLVFAFHRATVKSLKEYYKCPAITGGLSTDELAKVIDEANNGDCRVIVAQSGAAKYGLTLLGNKDNPCHTTVYYENDWSLDARIQSMARNHRTGQEHPVVAVDLIGSPIDRRILSALRMKDVNSLKIMSSFLEELGVTL